MNDDENKISQIFGKMSDSINGGERAILDFISVFVPWAVPVIPAYLTYWHTINEMGFPAWVARTAAFVVEALGLVSVATAIRFWKNNTLYKQERDKAPFWLAVAVYGFYIVIVLTVNVVLDIVEAQRSTQVIFAIGLFTLLSFPASVLIAIRAQFREQLEDRQVRRQIRHAPKQFVYNADSRNGKLDDRFTGQHRETYTRVCACGCGKTFTTTFPNKTTINATHRKRLQRKSHGNVTPEQ